MSQQQKQIAPKGQLSFSIRVSLWLIAAAILPLIITLAISEWYSRPTLTNQARTAMETDALTRSQLINNYFRDRILDVQSLAQVPLAQDFFLDPAANSGNIPLIVQNGKVVGSYLDPHYTLWALFDIQGKPLLSYSATNVKFTLHGRYVIPPEDVQRLLTGQPFVSGVYYDPATQKASVDIYVPSYSFTLKRPLGIVRATLTLDYIWSIVQSENGANGQGSYAFIVDENGVRIADPDPARRFTAIAPLNPALQQAFLDESRYGQGKTVPVLADDALNTNLHSDNAPKTFEIQPTGKSEKFQVTQQTLSVVPWTYIVLSPTNTVIAVANQQLLITFIIVLAVLLPVALIGLAIGRNISSPILRSVEHLRGSSEALATLASKQKSAAAEQMWVVEASQMGLKSVQYYNDATNIAVDQMSNTGTRLVHSWQTIDEHSGKQAVMQMIDTAQYVKKAVHFQSTSNEKLATAININTQVSEQLADGATSAIEASDQLQQVVSDLRHVVGQ